MVLQRCKAVFLFWLYAVGPADNGLCNSREANFTRFTRFRDAAGEQGKFDFFSKYLIFFVKNFGGLKNCSTFAVY